MKEKVNGVEIYYHKLGKGEPLLLLHGHHLDGGMFDKIVDKLSEYLKVDKSKITMDTNIKTDISLL